MTNLQLLLTIGIPSILVILSWMQSNQRLSRVEAALDKVGDDLRQFYRMIGKLEGRVESLERH